MPSRAGVKVMIRQDDNKGIIVAYFATLDGSSKQIVATIDLQLCRQCPEVFEKWKAALSDGLQALLAKIGIKTKGVTETRVFESN